MAARSHRSGTPVKSCSRMRATTKGISSVRGALGCQLARRRICSVVIFLPSRLRNTDSNTTRIETGRRDMGPTPAASSAGREWNLPFSPDVVVNSWSVSNNSSAIVDPPGIAQKSQVRTWLVPYYSVWREPNAAHCGPTFPSSKCSIADQVISRRADKLPSVNRDTWWVRDSRQTTHNVTEPPSQPACSLTALRVSR